MAMVTGAHQDTEPFGGAVSRDLPETLSTFRLTLTDDAELQKTWESPGHECSIGSHASNHVHISDPTVSRFHCEIRLDASGARIRDLGSRNGTMVDGVYVIDAFLRNGSILQLGRVNIRFDLGAEVRRVRMSEKDRFGSLVSTSVAMRAAFALLERAASSDGTVLLEGETGTGKTKAAEAIHLESRRRDQPFVLVDCGAVHETLIESELFGHEKGAFSGATDRRLGAFEEAAGGTLFLDEIGELPLSLQPKLLRAIDEGRVRRLGSNVWHKVDVRVIAATNRDLRAEVNTRRFREDLFFRLAVLRITLPPLRQRPEDIPALVHEILARMTPPQNIVARITEKHFIEKLKAAVWPGNVRELRNFLERCTVFDDHSPIEAIVMKDEPQFAIDPTMSYRDAARLARDSFERAYAQRVLEASGGNVTRAAQMAGIDRTSFHRIMQRHRIR